MFSIEEQEQILNDLHDELECIRENEHSVCCVCKKPLEDCDCGDLDPDNDDLYDFD